MDLSVLNIKKILLFFCVSGNGSFSYIFLKKSFSYISENSTLHFSAQALKIKELHPRKIYYASGNGNPKKIVFNFFHQKFLHYNQKEFLYHQ